MFSFHVIMEKKNMFLRSKLDYLVVKIINVIIRTTRYFFLNIIFQHSNNLFCSDLFIFNFLINTTICFRNYRSEIIYIMLLFYLKNRSLFRVMYKYLFKLNLFLYKIHIIYWFSESLYEVSVPER